MFYVLRRNPRSLAITARDSEAYNRYLDSRCNLSGVEAVQIYPRHWRWVRHRASEKMTDMPNVFGVDVALSEHAYSIVKHEFPHEFNAVCKVDIDGVAYINLILPIVDQMPPDDGSINLCVVAGDTMRKIASDAFYQVWSTAKLSGALFVRPEDDISVFG